MVIFDPKNVRTLGIKIRKISVWLVTAFVLCTGVCVLLCCFADDDRYVVPQILSIVIFTLSGWFCIGLYHLQIKPMKRELSFEEHMCQSTPCILRAKVVQIDNEITLHSFLKVYPVWIDSEQNRMLYWKKTADSDAIHVDDIYRIYVVDGYIVRYENDH